MMTSFENLHEEVSELKHKFSLDEKTILNYLLILELRALESAVYNGGFK